VIEEEGAVGKLGGAEEEGGAGVGTGGGGAGVFWATARGAKSAVAIASRTKMRIRWLPERTLRREHPRKKV